MSVCKRKLEDVYSMCNTNDKQQQESMKSEFRSEGGKDRVDAEVKQQVKEAKEDLFDATLERINQESNESLSSET